VYVDMHVEVARGTTIEEGHAIAHQVEKALRLKYGQITDVVVHLEPAGGVAAARRGEVDYREQRSPQEAP
jgi:divalent metal cation (Fe/Co/Zn/Cd) transporter